MSWGSEQMRSALPPTILDQACRAAKTEAVLYLLASAEGLRAREVEVRFGMLSRCCTSFRGFAWPISEEPPHADARYDRLFLDGMIDPADPRIEAFGRCLNGTPEATRQLIQDAKRLVEELLALGQALEAS
jgi:hypothetical protein